MANATRTLEEEINRLTDEDITPSFLKTLLIKGYVAYTSNPSYLTEQGLSEEELSRRKIAMDRLINFMDYLATRDLE